MKGLTGFNLPEHQEVISDLIYFIRKHFEEKGLSDQFSIAPELRVKTSIMNKGSFIPDIVIRTTTKTWNQPILIIEVSRSRGLKTDIKKNKKAVKYMRSMREGFIYDYETGSIFRILKQTLIEEENGYSNLLRIDLMSCIKK